MKCRRKYVEEQLTKKKGCVDQSQKKQSAEEPIDAPKSIEDLLFLMPDRLKTCRSAKNEEMLSNQMLCGIPEVDLGIEAKIKNIEETEAVKLKLLKESMAKRKDLADKLTARQNLAKDLAKSYVQHSIYKIEETTLIGSDSIRAKSKRPKTEPVPVVDEDTPKWVNDGQTVQRPDSVNEESQSRQPTKKDVINHSTKSKNTRSREMIQKCVRKKHPS